jgi:hypothetical protein
VDHPGITNGETIAVCCGGKSSAWPVISFAVIIIIKSQSLITKIIDPSTRLTSNVPRLHPSKEVQLLNLIMARLIRSGPYAHIFPPPYIGELSLQANQLRLCKFSQDKIYSILGLLPPQFSASITQTNYTQSIERFYTQVIKSFARFFESLHIICYAQHSDIESEMPTWTPDWRKRHRHLLCSNMAPDTQLKRHSVVFKRFRLSSQKTFH